MYFTGIAIMLSGILHYHYPYSVNSYILVNNVSLCVPLSLQCYQLSQLICHFARGLVFQCDAVSVLEKEHDYRDEYFDFIQSHIRRFCLQCILSVTSDFISHPTMPVA